MGCQTVGVAAGAMLGLVMVVSGAAAATDPLLERGTYLMNSIVACGNCHTPQTPDGPVPGMELAGGNPIEEPNAFTTYPPNITPDVETGIGSWTDEEIIRATREGIRPDGSLIGPPMPFEVYHAMSDSDVRAIVAYLRSVPPVHNEAPASVYNIPLPPAWGPPVGSVADVPQDDPVIYGAYLAGPLGHCIVCHSPAGPMGAPDIVNQLGAGGFEFHGPWGISVSANITSHLELGVGAVSDDLLKRAIAQGINRHGDPMAPPMAYFWYKNIAEQDLNAMIAYLRTLPPLGQQ